MPNDTTISQARLAELAERADRVGCCCFTPFLTPPEAELAQAVARKRGVSVELFGGYPDAERRIARFAADDAEPAPFPIATLEITWPHNDAPGHRDLLGSVMGLGVTRAVVGDIALTDDAAYLFVENVVADTIAGGLTQAGRTRLTVRRIEAGPALQSGEGTEMHCTVQSARLDAVVAEGFHMARGKAAELIEAGQVKLRYQQTLRPDAKLAEADTVSVRGFGRLVLAEIGAPTRKGRLPLRLIKYGK